MPLRVLLNNPPVRKVQEPWWDTPEFGRTGLACLAAYLRRHDDSAVHIVDSKFERLDFPRTLERIGQLRPEVVGFTAFTNEIKPAAEMAGRVKAAWPHVRTVIGGVHVTALPEGTLREFPCFDYGVHGEGELTFLELIQAIGRGGSDLRSIDGLVYRVDGDVRQNGPRQRTVDLDTLPLPAWDLLPPATTYYLQTSRGCPFTCKFCMNPNGRFFRHRSVAKIIEELRFVFSMADPRMIWYGDEIFTVNLDHTKALLRAKLREGFHRRSKWGCMTHVRFVDAELFRLMKEVNFELVGFGIETGDEDTLRRVGKGTTLEAIHAAREMARKHGVPITTYFILGQPDETRESIRKTIDLAVQLNPELPVIGVMVPYPGTEVARQAARGEAGYRMISTDWDDYNKQLGGVLEFANLSRTQIEWLQLYGYVKVFIANRRYGDLLRFVRRFGIAGINVVLNMVSRRFSKARAGRQRRRDGFVNTAEIEVATRHWQLQQTHELQQMKAGGGGVRVSNPARGVG